MTHFGIICPSSTGPLNTMLPLGQELQRRGHRVSVCGILDARPKVLVAGLEFQVVGEDADRLLLCLLTQLAEQVSF